MSFIGSQDVAGYKCVQGVYEKGHVAGIAPVYRVMAFPVAAGTTKGCLHIPGAINWAAMRMDNDFETSSMRYLFQTLLMTFEDRTTGTPYFATGVLDDVTDLDSLEDAITTKKGRLRPTAFRNPVAADHGSHVFDVHTGQNLFGVYHPTSDIATFQPKQQHPFRTSRPHALPVDDAIRPRVSVQDPSDRPSPTATSPPRGSRAAQTPQARLSALTAGLSGPGAEEPMSDDGLADALDGLEMDLRDAAAQHGRVDVRESDGIDEMEEVDMRSHQNRQGEEDESDEVSEVSEDHAPAEPARMADVEMPQIPTEMAKHVIQIVPVYRGGSGSKSERYLGHIIYVLIADPNVNPGASLENFFSYKKSGFCHRSPGRNDPTKGVKAVFQTMKGITDPLHASKHLSPASYCQSARMYIMQCIKGRTDAHARRLYEQYTRDSSHVWVGGENFGDYNNPFNPLRLFSTENALHFFEQLHNVNMSAYDPLRLVHPESFTSLRHGGFQVWSFVEAPQPAFRFRSADFVWTSPDKIGLAGQLLPWVNDVYQELCRTIVPMEAERQAEILSLLIKHEMEHFVPRYLMRIYEAADRRFDTFQANLRRFLRRYQHRLEELVEDKIQKTTSFQNSAALTAFGNTGYMQDVHQMFERTSTGVSQSSSLNWIIGFHDMNGGFRKALMNMCMRTRNGRPFVRELFHRPELPTLAQWNASHTEYSNMMRHMSHHLALLYKSQIWQRNAVLTVPMKALYNFQFNYNKKGRPGFTKVTSPNRLTHLELDYFGNYIQQKAQVLRHINFNFKCTRDIILLVHGCSYDCFRQEMDMHFHSFVCGPPEASKTRSAKQAEELCVEGTVAQETDSSNLADTVDQDRSDFWTVYDEIPVSMVRKPGVQTDDDASTSRIKSILTECLLTRRVLIQGDADPTGRRVRTNQIIRTNIIQTLSLSSNVSMAQMPSAIISRLYTQVVSAIPSSNDTYQTIEQVFEDAERAAAESNQEISSSQRRANHRRRRGQLVQMHKVSPTDVEMTRQGNLEKKKTTDEQKRGQIMQFLVGKANKFIYEGILPEPNMDVAQRIIFRLINYLRNRGKITNTSVRDYQRIMIMARSMTIVNAALSTFHNEYTASFAGRDFQLEHLLYMGPHLVCTKQVAIYAFTLLQEQYVSPMKAAVITTMMRMANYPHEGLKSKVKSKAPYSYLFTEDYVNVNDAFEEKQRRQADRAMLIGDDDSAAEEGEGEEETGGDAMDVEIGDDVSGMEAEVRPPARTPLYPGLQPSPLQIAGVQAATVGESASTQHSNIENFFGDDMLRGDKDDESSSSGSDVATEEASDLIDADDERGRRYKSAYEWFTSTTDPESALIKWRTETETGSAMGGNGDMSVGKSYIDLNYVSLQGSVDKVAQDVLNNMPVQYAKDDIKTFIMNLSKDSIEVPAAYNKIEYDKAIDHIPGQNRRKLNVVEIDPSRENPRVHLCISSMDRIVSQSLIEDAIRSLAYKKMQPQTYLLGTMEQMDRPDLGLFDQMAITEEDCANSKYENFNVTSPLYMPPRLRRMLFVDATMDPDELDMDPSTNKTFVLQSSYAAQAFGKRRGISSDQDYHEGRDKKVLSVDRDLDEWAFVEHFVRAGYPLRYDPETDEYHWLPLHHRTDTATDGDWELLPTPHNLMTRHRRMLRKDTEGLRRLDYVYNGKRPRDDRRLLLTQGGAAGDAGRPEVAGRPGGPNGPDTRRVLRLSDPPSDSADHEGEEAADEENAVYY